MLFRSPADLNGQPVLRLAMTPAKLAEIREYSIKQNLTTVRNRVNELGVAEPIVQRQGANRIVVELPGVQDTAEAKRILGKTANLEFRLAAEPGASKATSETFEFREGNRPPAQIERGLIITGDQVTDAKAGFGEHGTPEVNIRLDGHGGELMSRATRSNVGRSMAVIFIEQRPITTYTKQMVNGVEKARSTWQHDVMIKVQVADGQHPITRGVKDFTIHDEAYGKYDMGADSHALLTTENPLCAKYVAWAKTYGPARVAYIQLGHDHYAFEDPNYRRLVANAIQWTANKKD